MGYAEAGGAGWDLSAGRRKLSFGPAGHGLAIGADNPYYDGLVARVEAPVGAAALEYAYVLVSARRSGDRLKNLVLNALSLRAEGFQVGIAELNVVSGPSPDFLDIGPFVVYHHLFQSDSNVMLELNFSWTPLTGFSLFGEAVMDDFRLSQEGKDSNPTAMGFMGGLEWAPGLARRSVPRPSFYGADHVLPIAAGPLATQGTRIRAELYWTSTYLWGRGGGSDNTFRERYFIHSDAWTIVEPLLAAPLLPDSILARLVARTTRSGPLEGELALEYRILGENAISGPGAMAYAPPYNEDWLGPSGSTTEKLGLKVGGLYAFDERTVVSAAARLTWTEGGGLDYDFSAGAGLRLGSGGRRLP